MFAILVAAAALAAAPAPNSTPFSDGRPPEVFQGDATVTLEFAAQARIDTVCQPLFGKPPSGMQTRACDTGKRVVMPNPCSFPDSDSYAHLLCHELGHVNGWPASHGDYPIPVSAPKPPPASAPVVRAAAATSVGAPDN